MAAAHRTPLAMGDAFRDAARVLARRAPILLLMSMALVFTSTAGAAWLRYHPPLGGAGVLVGLGNWLADWFTITIPYSLFIAAASWTVAEVLEDRSPTAGETLSQGLRLALPVLTIQILYLLGTVAGALLLIVPGIIVALMWILAPSALIVERLGIIDAFKRSRALTKGHRWALLGLMVAYTLAAVALEWMIFRISSPGMSFVLAATAPVNAYGVVPLFTALTAPLNCVVMTAIYMRLRNGHRAPAEVTAEVFA